MCYVAWFDLISFSENIEITENISTRKGFWKFFCRFWLMNGVLWILLAKYLKLWKWPKPLPYMTYGLIFFLLNARGQIVFSLSSSMSNLEGAIQQFCYFEVTLFLDTW